MIKKTSIKIRGPKYLRNVDLINLCHLLSKKQIYSQGSKFSPCFHYKHGKGFSTQEVVQVSQPAIASKMALIGSTEQAVFPQHSSSWKQSEQELSLTDPGPLANSLYLQLNLSCGQNHL